MTIAAIVTIVGCIAGVSYGQMSDWSLFKDFQQKFNKNYDSLKEFESRFSIFQTNLQYIISHNNDITQNFTIGVNKFTDLTPDEFRKQFIGSIHPVTSHGCKPFSSGASSSLPSSIDWRTKGAVSSVKDQGQCGSCWAFSSTGAVEGAWALHGSPLVDLSEQELVDCATGVSYGSNGCNGGQMDGAFKYVIEHGQCLLTDYPYVSGVSEKGGSCQKCAAVAHISSCSDVKSNDQVSLKVAVSQQPVAVAIEADTRYFQSYSSGVLDSAACGTSLDHGVLIVGYGAQNGQDYWLVKNSWSETWGEQGYIKILRSDSTNDPGICGIAMEASFPTV